MQKSMSLVGSLSDNPKSCDGSLPDEGRDVKYSIYDRVAIKACSALTILVFFAFSFEFFRSYDSVRLQPARWALVLGLSLVASFMLGVVWYLRSKERETALKIARVKCHKQSFDNALQLIGDPNVTVRIGAIQSLGRLLDENLIGMHGWTVDDHNSVIGVLEGYIRTSLKKSTPKKREEEDKTYLEDVRAAIRVLGRQRWTEIVDEMKLDFTQVNFHNISFYRVNLRGTDFFEARFRSAVFREAKLVGANFARAFLNQVDFERAELVGACLSGASLSGAKLCSADLSESNLAGAVLCGADLQGANLRGANLQGASLTEANLKDAVLSGADFTGAYYSSRTRFPERFDPETKGMIKSDY